MNWKYFGSTNHLTSQVTNFLYLSFLLCNTLTVEVIKGLDHNAEHKGTRGDGDYGKQAFQGAASTRLAAVDDYRGKRIFKTASQSSISRGTEILDFSSAKLS